jgi:hypothetical protein
MKTKGIFLKSIITFLTGVFAISAFLPGFAAQDDTVVIRNVSVPPIIDGIGDDACWTDIKWQAIDQVWIHYGENVEASDYNGRYKAVWSSKENLLYFLVEINDDVAIDGFREGITADVYNYDIIEVFLDEDKSGGPHIYDNPGTQENAENAFSYHIYADFPAEGEVNKTCWVGDIPAPHTQHLPEFAIRRTGETAVREFSLKVYDDTYVENNPEASRVILTAGKKMGLSLAYCDNDADDGMRDNFFGSVWVIAENYNNHWMNADDYGLAMLYSDIDYYRTIEQRDYDLLQVYPNPTRDNIQFSGGQDIRTIEIMDVTGKTISRHSLQQIRKVKIPVSDLAQGLYYVRGMSNKAGICMGKFLKL